MSNEAYCIKQLHNLTYLSATTGSYGSQAGVARSWSYYLKDAIIFVSREDAEAALTKEWPHEDERRYSGAFIQRVA